MAPKKKIAVMFDDDEPPKQSVEVSRPSLAVIQQWSNVFLRASFFGQSCQQLSAEDMRRLLSLSCLPLIRPSIPPRSLRIPQNALKQFYLAAAEAPASSFSFVSSAPVMVQHFLMQFAKPKPLTRAVRLSHLDMFTSSSDAQQGTAHKASSESEEMFTETKPKRKKPEIQRTGTIQNWQTLEWTPKHSYHTFVIQEALQRKQYILEEEEYKVALAGQLATDCAARRQELKSEWLQQKAQRSKICGMMRKIPELSKFLNKQGQQLKRIENDIKQQQYYNQIRKKKIDFYLEKTTLMCEQIAEKIKEQQDVPLPLLLDQTAGSPRQYQVHGMRFLVACARLNYSCLLADDLGLGKTLQAIMMLCQLAADGIQGPHLIIVPSTLIYNWEQELNRWAPGFKVLVYYGARAEREKLRQGWSYEGHSQVVLTSYQVAVVDSQFLRRRNFYFLIMDEAHLIRNQRSKAWNSLLDLRAAHRLLISGTPISNSSNDIWSLLHFVLPGIFSSKQEFLQLFSRDIEKMADGELAVNRHVVRHIHQLLRPFMLRRIKSEVESQLPKKSEFIVPCPLTRRQLYLYSEFINQSETRKKIQAGGYMGAVNVLTNLRRICNHPRLVEASESQSGFFIRDGIYLESEKQTLLEHQGEDFEYRIFREYQFCQESNIFLEKMLRQFSSVDVQRKYQCGCCGQFKQLIVKPRLTHSCQYYQQDNIIFDFQKLNLIDRMPLKQLRHVSPRQLDFMLDVEQDYTTNLLYAVQTFSNWKFTYNSCEDHDFQLNNLCQTYTRIHNKVNDLYFTNTFQLKFEQDAPIRINSANTTRNCFQMRSKDSFTQFGAAWTLSGVSPHSYCYDQNVLQKLIQNEPKHILDVSQVASDEIQNIHLKSVVLNLLQVPIFDFRLLRLVFDPLCHCVSMMSRATYAAFLGSSLTKNVVLKICGLLNVPILDRDLLKTLQFGIHRVACGFESLSAQPPTMIGRIRHRNQFLNEMYKSQIFQDQLSLIEQFKIPYPNSMFWNETKIQQLTLKANIKMAKMHQQQRFYTCDMSLQEFEKNYYGERLQQQSVRDQLQENLPSELILDIAPPKPVVTEPDPSNTQTKTEHKKHKLVRATKKHLTITLSVLSLIHLSVPPICTLSIVNNQLSDQQLHRNPYVALPFIAGRSCQFDAAVNDLNSFAVNCHQFSFGKKLSPFQLVRPEQFYKQQHLNLNESDEFQYYISLRPQSVLGQPTFWDVNDIYTQSSARKYLQLEDKSDLVQQSGKLIILQQLLTKLHKQGAKTLIFTQQHKMLDLLELFLNFLHLNFFRMDGTTPPKTRMALVDRFNATPTVFAFIMTTRTGGIGLNLTGANTVIFVDTDWNPQVHQQATDRVHRINQQREVSVYTLLSEYTCEENIVRRATQKKHLDKLILRDGVFLPEYFDQQSDYQQQIEKRFGTAEKQLDLVYVNLINQDQLRQRLGDVLDAYQDDDDKNASAQLVREWQGDQTELEAEGDDAAVVETSKQIVEQLNIYNNLEKTPKAFLQYFEAGYDAVESYAPAIQNDSEILGFSREAMDLLRKEEELDELRKLFTVHKIDQREFKTQLDDLNNYAMHDLQEDVKVMDKTKKRVVRKATDIQVRKIQWVGK